MLSLASIEQYYPPAERPFKRNMLREYLQYKILEIIFNTDVGQKLSFLGGTALRIVYGNCRFSEDLDFDNFGLTEEQFSSLVDSVKVGLAQQGYEVEVKNVFKGAWRAYIKIPQVLFDNKITGDQREKIMIQVDTVPHAFDYAKETYLLNKFDVFTNIFTTPLDILLAQKIYAVMNRARAQGRDFFDLVFLLPKVTPNYEYLKQKIGVSDGKSLKKIFLEKIGTLDFDELAQDVAPFLISQNDLKKVKMFPEYFASLNL